MVGNMLQLMHFSVYFKGILNTDNGYFHIKIMISAGHMLGGSWASSLRKFLKKMQLSAFWCFFVYYIRAPQTSSFACYMRPHSGPFLSFSAYYMGAPSDQFLHLLWRPPYVFFSYYMEPLGSFLCILYWAPQITFFAYYMGPLRSVSSHTIWGPLSDQFHCLLYAPPPSDQFLCML